MSQSTSTTRSGVLIVLASQTSHQFGAAFAILLFSLAGPLGTVSLRLGIAAVLLLIILRPKLRGLPRKAWTSAILLGISFACMNTTLYFSFERLHLGTAVTIEMLGPIVLTVILARKLSAWFWALIAFAGIVILGLSGTFAGGQNLDKIGVIFALAAALCWALNIVFSWRTAQLFRGADGLAVAMVVATILVLPFGIFVQGASLFEPKILFFGLFVAVFSSALPYALDQFALRRLKASQFAMMMSLAPAFASLVGIVVLGQPVTYLDIIGILLVVVATVFTMRERQDPGPKDPPSINTGPINNVI